MKKSYKLLQMAGYILLMASITWDGVPGTVGLFAGALVIFVTTWHDWKRGDLGHAVRSVSRKPGDVESEARRRARRRRILRQVTMNDRH